ncbi:MAG: DoxX family membrane protein [Acidobacteria bacterium]|nr:DoxX family membrane protein [Acidobacteriota bacterium]
MPADPRALAALVARSILGLIFFMAGWWKVFRLGALQHAQSGFVEPYAETWLPAWALWATGTAVPFVELIAGGLMLVGWLRWQAALGLGGVLVLVTFGHLLAEPLFAFDAHVVPRTVLLVVVLALFEEDRWSVDGWRRRRRAAGN